jgi:hypothetical protein
MRHSVKPKYLRLHGVNVFLLLTIVRVKMPLHFGYILVNISDRMELIYAKRHYIEREIHEFSEKLFNIYLSPVALTLPKHGANVKIVSADI